jgi:hypothetical protein
MNCDSEENIFMAKKCFENETQICCNIVLGIQNHSLKYWYIDQNMKKKNLSSNDLLNWLILMIEDVIYNFSFLSCQKLYVKNLEKKSQICFRSGKITVLLLAEKNHHILVLEEKKIYQNFFLSIV